MIFIFQQCSAIPIANKKSRRLELSFEITIHVGGYLIISFKIKILLSLVFNAKSYGCKISNDPRAPTNLYKYILHNIPTLNVR